MGSKYGDLEERVKGLEEAVYEDRDSIVVGKILKILAEANLITDPDASDSKSP